MKTPVWIKPSLGGAVAGAIATIIVGFGWGGWMLGSTADHMAAQRSAQAVTQALVPVCVSRSTTDPDKLKELADINYAYERQNFVAKAGWAAMPGSDKPNRDLAAACAQVLEKSGQT